MGSLVLVFDLWKMMDVYKSMVGTDTWMTRITWTLALIREMWSHIQKKKEVFISYTVNKKGKR